MTIEKILALCEQGTELLDSYVNTKTTIRAKCPSGHVRNITPGNLLYRGSGAKCLECKGTLANNKKSTEFYRQELLDIYGEKWTLEGEYLGANIKHKFTCSNGHVLEQYASAMLTKHVECRVCQPYRKPLGRTSVEFQEILDPLGLILISEYKGAKQEVLVQCEQGHEYTIVPHNLISHAIGSRCAKCYPETSKPEQSLVSFIRSNYQGWIETNDRSILSGQELDVVLPDLGLAFEFNGTYYHSSKFKSPGYHQDKTNRVENIGFKLCHVHEHDWKYSRPIVESRILNMLGKSKKIYARECEIKPIDFPRSFLDKNHLQGFGAPTKYNYGLFYRGELVAVMTFGSARFNNSGWELYRFCSCLNTTVIGGAGKLLSRFLKDYEPQLLYTYASRDWSTGDLYEKLGFDKVSITPPNYYYIKGSTKLSRYKCSKDKLISLVPEAYSPELSETEIMNKAGFYKIYDSGNIKYELRKYKI